MAKKIVKKRKIKILPLILMLGILILIIFAIDLYLNTSIKNITILDTDYLTDEYIMKLSKLEKYPSFYYTTSRNIKNNLLKSPYIKKVKVSKGFYHTLTVNVTEKKAVFFDVKKDKYILEDGSEVDQTISFRVPRLVNEVPNDKYKELIKKVQSIQSDILAKVSEISYVPNDYDKDRFLLYMDDDNAVYLTLTKFKKLNYYNEVLEQLEGKKGILYLDSGNHFKIMG